MLFAVKNPHIYQTNSSVNGMNTRQQKKPHMFSVRLFSMQSGVYYSFVMISNHLPKYIFIFHSKLCIFKIC